MAEFEIGNKVAIRGVGIDRDALQVRTVARVLKRFVELDNGSKFTHNGSVYPRQEYSSTRLLLLTPELEAEARRQSFVRFLGTRKWDSMPTETLAKIVSLVRS